MRRHRVVIFRQGQEMSRGVKYRETDAVFLRLGFGVFCKHRSREASPLQSVLLFCKKKFQVMSSFCKNVLVMFSRVRNCFPFNLYFFDF